MGGAIRLRIGAKEQTIQPRRRRRHSRWGRARSFSPEDTEVIDFFAPVREDFLTGETPPYMSQG